MKKQKNKKQHTLYLTIFEESSYLNCDKNPLSFVQNSLMSGISYKIIAQRSNPNPKAQPAISCAPANKKKFPFISIYLITQNP